MTSQPPPPKQHVHQAPPPNDDAQLAAEIAGVLLVGGATAILVTALMVLFRKRGEEIDRAVMEAALGLASSGTAAKPNARLKGHNLRRGMKVYSIPRTQTTQELGFRARYLLNAVRRIQASVKNGLGVKEALTKESPYFGAHEQARKNRLDAAGRVADSARSFGPILGWYRNPESNSEADCLAADGCNFEASEGTIIGWPGSVHPHCNCEPGPPHEPIESTPMVNDKLRGVIGLPRRKTALKDRERSTA